MCFVAVLAVGGGMANTCEARAMAAGGEAPGDCEASGSATEGGNGREPAENEMAGSANYAEGNSSIIVEVAKSTIYSVLRLARR